MFTFKEIYSAYLKCRKGKRNTYNALKFETNLCENICNLETLLNTKTYTPKRSVCFLTTSPKLREVFAVLKFSKATNYYLQLDIKNFFYSIDKKTLFSMLNKTIVHNYHKVKKSSIQLNEMLWIVHKIIFHDVTKDAYLKGSRENFTLIPPHKTLFKVSKNKGLAIGNLTSQFFANVYMNDFDNYCKRVLKCKRYIRYVDDFVIFEESKEKLIAIQKKIELYLQEHLALQLRESYTKVCS